MTPISETLRIGAASERRDVLADFLDGFDRLVAFDAGTTGKRTPDAEFIRKQLFAWRAPGIIIEVGFVENAARRRGLAQVNAIDQPVDPRALTLATQS